MATSFLKVQKTVYVLITVFTAALLILALKTGFVIVGFKSEARWRRQIVKPKEQRTPMVGLGYVLSYRFWDQTSGVVNVMSLQCWAKTMNMTVPEHFLTLYRP